MENETVIEISEGDLKALVSSAIEEHEETKSVEAAAREALRAEVRTELEKEYAPTARAGFYTKKVSQLGFRDDPVKGFMHWIRSGQPNSQLIKATANVLIETDSDASGGYYLVPQQLYSQIIEKRDEISIARAMGAFVIQCSSDSLRVPIEGTSQAIFGITAEEGAYEEDEGTISAADIAIYKFTKIVKLSEELVDDQAANLDEFLVRAFARWLGVTENAYFVAGTGSSQPQGALVGGTAGLTLDSASAIAAAEVPELFYKLASEYRQNSAWSMTGVTEGYIRGLSGNPFSFAPTPMANGSWRMDSILGRPVFNSAYMGTIGVSAKTMLVGDWSFYAIAERSGLEVKRLEELYAANGLVALRAKARFGGAVLHAEAFQYATHPTA